MVAADDHELHRVAVDDHRERLEECTRGQTELGGDGIDRGHPGRRHELRIVEGGLERHGLPADTTLTDLAANADLRAEIDAAVTDANAKVSKAEAIKKFVILDTDFTIESGQLTPTLKLKRNVIHTAYQQAIADLYT